MARWKDVTTHSKGEKDRTPRSWDIVLPIGRLVVTRLVGTDQSEWYWTMGGSKHALLKSVDVEDAKREAEALMLKRLERSITLLTAAEDDNG